MNELQNEIESASYSSDEGDGGQDEVDVDEDGWSLLERETASPASSAKSEEEVVVVEEEEEEVLVGSERSSSSSSGDGEVITTNVNDDLTKKEGTQKTTAITPEALEETTTTTSALADDEARAANGDDSDEANALRTKVESLLNELKSTFQRVSVVGKRSLRRCGRFARRKIRSFKRQILGFANRLTPEEKSTILIALGVIVALFAAHWTGKVTSSSQISIPFIA